MATAATQRLTPYLLFVLFSITLGAFQYGYHIGELNTPQGVISKCKTKAGALLDPFAIGRPPCLPMSDARYALIVSMLTVGGILGALLASVVSNRFGRRLSLCGTAVTMGIGSALMAVATSSTGLMVGRFMVGLGAGVVTVVVPAYIAECVPETNRGFFGTLNQLAIVLGILTSQVIGMAWSPRALWRPILAGGAVLGVIQLVLLPFCVDSPRHIASLPGGLRLAKHALFRLRGPPMELVEEEVQSWRRDQQDGVVVSQVNIYQFLTEARHRRPLGIIVLLQLAQQCSGINAVIFYSTSIMSALFPESSDRITVYISLVNLAMTLVSAYFMDKAGRRTLCLTSMIAMASMSVVLGWSMEGQGREKIAAIAIVCFVAAFAIGLGPIPFLMLPELVETPTVASAASVGLTVNMGANFVVSASFLGLRDALGQGAVFFLFGTTLCVLSALAWKFLPETKGRSPEEIVRSKWAVSRTPPTYHVLSSVTH